MNVSRRWLEEFLRRPLDARDVARRLAMLGAPVDAIEPLAAHLEPFVVGLVTEVRQHPNAEKLHVTTVDDGTGEMHQVVCGAPNVAAGGKYPFARIGTVMPGGMLIERRKLRGEASEGMLCSARELGLGEDHDGLLALDTDAAPGTPLLAVLPVGDDRLIVDVTPNRADLLGHKGVARELAASYGVPFRLPDLPGIPDPDIPPPTRFVDEAVVGGVRLAIVDRDGCGRFLGAVIRGVKVGPSPAWLVERLAAVGARSINNVVDATNYVMLELNQPMHAYDAATLKGPAVIARVAAPGEALVTLDGVRRELPRQSVVIADAERAIGLAGVMGGLDTEVTATTTDIFVECAWFAPSRIRAARRAVMLSTDASHRFERGTDRWGAVDAFRRCLRLILGLAGGELDGPTVDCFPAPSHPPRVFLRPTRVAQVLGLDLPWSEIEKQLVAIGAMMVSKPDDGRIAVDVPGWRPDLASEIDLIEEIARHYGYDRIPDALRGFRPGLRTDDPMWLAASPVRQGLMAAGLSEAQLLPMVADEHDRAPRVLNPLSADHAWLRTSLLPGLVRQVEQNWAVSTPDVRLFEIGTVFARRDGSDRPDEETRAALVVTGRRRPPHWSDGGKAPIWDLWDARALFGNLVALAHPGAVIQVEGEGWVALAADGRTVGRCQELTADRPRWAERLYGAEVAIVGSRPVAHRYQAPAGFPAVARDLALLVPPARSAAELLSLLEKRGERFGLEQATVIDEFRGAGVPPGWRSLALRLVFRSAERTLTDKEVDQAIGKLLASLERELDVTLRST